MASTIIRWIENKRYTGFSFTRTNNYPPERRKRNTIKIKHQIGNNS